MCLGAALSTTGALENGTADFAQPVRSVGAAKSFRNELTQYGLIGEGFMVKSRLRAASTYTFQD
jgi:hypothetical protein